MQRLTLWPISLTSQAFCTRNLIYLHMPGSLYFQDKWDGFWMSIKNTSEFFIFDNKVPAWEVLLLKHLKGKHGACIRNVRKLHSERSQAVASGSGITGHAIHLSNEPYIYTSGHLWQQAWHRSDSTWKPAGRFWARGSKQKRLGIEASCFRVSACWKVKSKYSWLFSDVLGVL